MSSPPARLSDRSRFVRTGSTRSVAELIEAAHELEEAGHRSEARELLELALGSLTEVNPKRASSLLRWIALSWERDSDYGAAEDVAAAALAVAEASGDDTAIGHALNVFGVVRWRQGALTEAEDLLHAAVAQGGEGIDPAVISYANTNLGTIASVRGDFREALRYFQEALTIGRRHALPENLLPTLINLGVTNMALARLDAADEAFAEASRIAEALGGLRLRIMIEVNRASLEVARGDLDAATRHCDVATSLGEHVDDRLSHGELRKVYGVIAKELEDHAGAEAHLAAAKRIATELGNLELEGEAARELADLYARTGRNRETLQALNRAHQCFDQLRSKHALADVARRMNRLEGDFLTVVRRWGESIESQDLHTHGHCERVADLATALATRHGMDEGSLFWFRIGALLHDVGKLIVPAELLNKAGRLTDEEWALMCRHPVAGVELLADVEFPWDIAPMVRSHHERWDGAGYPDGLIGEQIPTAARILCIADVYDALTSARSYKRPFTHLEAMEIMRAGVGRQFDPQIFPLFEALLRETTPDSGPRLFTDRPKRKITSSLGGAEEDDLTGALVRRAFIDVATAVLAERRRTNGVASLLVIDVDSFKSVNDSFGHLSGDDALRVVAETAQQQLRPGQYVGRYAGDEFTVLLPSVDALAAQVIAETIRTRVAARTIARRDEPESSFGVTLSIGVATSPLHGMTFEALFGEADRALFESKRDGRNRVSVAGADFDAAPQLSFSRFVGRQAELRALVNALEVASSGAPRLRCIVGEAGVGKSTLVRQLTPELRLRGAAGCWGRAFESSSPPPYGPWSELVADIDAQGMTPPGGWPLLSRLVPTLSRSDEPPAAFDPSQGYQMLRELVRYLQGVASARPLVIVLEDMHWGDAASWDALEYVMAQLTSERICVLLTMRAEEATVGPGRERRQRLSRDERSSELPLKRLTLQEIGEILRGGMQRVNVDAELTDFVVRHTEGNAFLLMQLLGAMIEEGVFSHEGGIWRWSLPSSFRLPNGMTDLVARRLNRLQPVTVKVLAVAAAIGRTFPLEFVAAAAGLPLDTVLDAVDDALTTSVLEPSDGERDDSYRFAHSLLVDAVLRTMNVTRRRAVHERVGDLLRERTPHATSAIAAQYARGADMAKGYEWCRRAAAEALSLYALDEARSFLELAATAASSDAERIDVHDESARVAELSGRWADVETDCDRVLAEPGIEREPARALTIQLRRLQARVRLGLGVQDAERDCREYLARAESLGSLNEIVQTRCVLVQLLARKGEVEEAITLAEESQRLAELACDEPLVADVMYRRAVTLNAVRPAEAATVLLDLVASARARGDRGMEARGQLALGVARSRTEDDAGGAIAFRLALELALDAQAMDVAANASMNLGVLEMRTGAFDSARTALNEAQRLYTTLRNNANRLVAIYNLANVERERGGSEEAPRLYGDAVELAIELSADDIRIGAHAGAGLSALRTADVETAVALASEATRLLGDRHEWWFQGRELLESLTIRTMISAGDHDEALDRFTRAVDRLEAMERYAATWFVADCAGALVAVHPSILPIIDRFAVTADAHGFAPLSARFTAMRDNAERSGFTRTG